MSEKVQYPRDWVGEKRASFCKKWACELCGFNFVPLTPFTSSTKCFSHRSVILTILKRMCQDLKLKLLLPWVDGMQMPCKRLNGIGRIIFISKPRMAKLVLTALIFLTVKSHRTKILRREILRVLFYLSIMHNQKLLYHRNWKFSAIMQQITLCNKHRHILWQLPHKVQSMGGESWFII